MLEICSDSEAGCGRTRAGCFCASCAWPKKFSPPAKPNPTWKVPVSFSLTDTSRIILSSPVAPLLVDLHAVEEAQGGDARLRVAHGRPVVEVAFGDLHLPGG